MNEIMKIRNLSKIYGKKEVRTTVLNNLSLDIEEGDFIAVMGPSGAGKSTLLNLLSTIDKPTQGSIILDGQELTAIRNEKLAKLRKEHIGFIFQDYNLLDNMTLMDNIALPLSLSNEKAKNIQQRVQEMAGLFHLEGHLEKYPHQLSGGQKPVSYTHLDVYKRQDVKWPNKCLLISIERQGKELLPKGSTVLHTGDKLIALLDDEDAPYIQHQLEKCCSSKLE